MVNVTLPTKMLNFLDYIRLNKANWQMLSLVTAMHFVDIVIHVDVKKILQVILGQINIGSLVIYYSFTGKKR